MGKLASIAYGAGLNKLGDTIKRTGQIATDPLGMFPKGKTVVDAKGNMYQTTKGVSSWDGNSSAPQVAGASNQKAPSGNSSPVPLQTLSSKADNAKASQTAKNIATKNASKAAQDTVGRSWNDHQDYVDQVKSDVRGLEDPTKSLADARDAMLGAYDRQHQKEKDAISGNRELIQRNQKSDLSRLAEDVRGKIFGSNIALGAAANGSASGAISRLIQKQAGQQRADTLTGYGDQISEQNQAEQNASELYSINRKKAYDWEDQMKKQAIDRYNANKAVLDRLIEKAPDWKKSDLKSESEKNLQVLLTGLASVSQEARNYRDYIAGVMNEANNSTVEIDRSAVGIDKPSALETPTFDPTLNIPTDGSVDPNAEDFFNPKVTQKKRYSTDVFGNPLTFDEAMNQ